MNRLARAAYVAAVFFLGLATTGCRRKTSSESRPIADEMINGVRVGEVGSISGGVAGSTGHPWMTKSKSDLDSIVRLTVAQDDASAMRLIRERSIALTPKTRARLVSIKRFESVVEVAIVDGPNAGTNGWLLASYFEAR